MSDLNIALVLRFIDQATAPARAAVQNIQAASEAVQRHGQSQMDAGRAMSERAQAQTSALRGQTLATIGTGMAFYAMMRPAVEFEQAMAQVGAVANTTAEEQELLTQTARALGASTAFSAREAASGMQYLAMAGFDVGQTIAAMPGVLDLAAASGASLGDTANFASNILSGFGLEAEEMARVGDVLTNTFTSSNTTLSTLAAAMTYAAPAARGVGLDLEYVSAMAGLLGNQGIAGERAGTALRAMLTRLAAPSTAAAEALDDLNVRTTDAEGNLRHLPDILFDLNEAMSGMGTATRDGLLSAIFGMEAMGAASILMGEAGSGALQAYAESLRETGSAAQIAARMNDTAQGALRRLNSAYEEMMIALGDGFLPMLAQIVEGIMPVVIAFGRWIEANPELVGQIGWLVAGLLAMNVAALAVQWGFWLLFGWVGKLRWAYGALVASAAWVVKAFLAIPAAAAVVWGALGRLVVIGASLAGTVLGFLVRQFLNAGLAVMWLGRMMMLAGRALLTNPILLAIALIAGAAYLIYQNWDGIVEYFSEKIDRVRAAFDDGLINGVFALLAEFNPFTLIMDAAEGLFTYITGWSFDDVAQALRGVFDIDLLAAGTALMHSLWNGMLALLADIIAWATGLAGEIGAAIVSGASAVWTAGAELIQSLWDGAVAKFSEFLAWVRDIPARIIAAIGNIDLSGVIRWPTMPSWLGGGTSADIPPDQAEMVQRAEAAGWTRPNGSRAIGGPVRPGFIYEINEQGQEFFMPDSPGRVIPADMMEAARPASLPQMLERRSRDTRPSGGFSIGDIHIHAAAGMDPRAIAEQVRRVLRDEARAAGYALHDGGLHAT